jgi:hypothetical protein
MGQLTIPFDHERWVDRFDSTEEDTDIGSGLSD